MTGWSGATLRRLQHLAGQVTLAALDASVATVGARRLAELVPAESVTRDAAS